MATYFAVSAPGLEEITAQELRGLDLNPELEAGGITFRSDEKGLYRANFHSRTASRILARVGQFFYALTFAELREKAGRLPWERFLQPGQPISIRVTCHKSKLIHSDAVAERIAGAIYDRLGKESPLVKPQGDETASPVQLVLVRVANDQVQVSMDSSGELLHRRGYRLAVAKAPLRETIAAAMLLASGWQIGTPLLDPFCGSGTIPIEAALLALRIPPGLNRRFAFMDWPGYDANAWQAVKAEASPLPVEKLPIFASDRDAGAVKMAHENAARAGVEDAIQFDCQALSSITPPAGPGWVVTNPPYGVRVSEGRDLRNLYAQLGNVLRVKCPGWTAAVLASDPQLVGQTRLALDPAFYTSNGGISVRMFSGVVD